MTPDTSPSAGPSHCLLDRELQTGVEGRPRAVAASSALVALMVAVGCGGSHGDRADLGEVGGFVAGATDTHCSGDGGSAIAKSTSPRGCTFRPDGGGDALSAYGATLMNSEGSDDQCKYRVRVTASPIVRHAPVTFTLAVTRAVDGQAATAAGALAEVFLSDSHAGQSGDPGVEGPPGTYAIDNVQFDRAGTWTVRFHLYEACLDYAADSPHGHVAFLVRVP